MGNMFTIGSLFSGIGGLELGLEWSGLGRVIWQAESNPYCQKVLEKHWPGVKRYKDVREITKETRRPNVVCGGFPCQDISSAGKGKGLAGSRSGLWFEFARVIRELRPEWVVVENVGSAATRWVDPVRWHLELLGYETIPIPLSARLVGAPHRRRRVFIVAHTYGKGQHAGALDAEMAGTSEPTPDTDSEPMERTAKPWEECDPWEFGSGVRRVAYGVPSRVDRLRALGNAVVPQCAEVVGHVIQELCR